MSEKETAQWIKRAVSRIQHRNRVRGHVLRAVKYGETDDVMPSAEMEEIIAETLAVECTAPAPQIERFGDWCDMKGIEPTMGQVDAFVREQVRAATPQVTPTPQKEDTHKQAAREIMDEVGLVEKIAAFDGRDKAPSKEELGRRVRAILSRHSLREELRSCRNPNHALTDGSAFPHEIGPSCMAEAAGQNDPSAREWTVEQDQDERILCVWYELNGVRLKREVAVLCNWNSKEDQERDEAFLLQSVSLMLISGVFEALEKIGGEEK
jgi:hypothetical protein